MPNHLLDSERKDHFVRQLRHDVLQVNRRERDEETRRMEEYRKLCAKEGIESKRLQEYDAARRQHNEAMDTSLHAIDEDESITAAEKRRRKFALKRKAAMRQSNHQLVIGASNPALKKMEAKQKEQQAVREAETAQREEQKKDHTVKIAERIKMQRLYAMKTKSGQPVMRSRMDALLHKIQAATAAPTIPR